MKILLNSVLADGAAELHTSKIKDNHTVLMNLGNHNAFARGFSLTVKLMVEAMSSEKT